MRLLLARFGPATTSELSLILGVKRKLALRAKGSFWRKAAGHRHVRSRRQNGHVTLVGSGLSLTQKRHHSSDCSPTGSAMQKTAP
jgi:hypothetical protein